MNGLCPHMDWIPTSSFTCCTAFSEIICKANIFLLATIVNVDNNAICYRRMCKHINLILKFSWLELQLLRLGHAECVKAENRPLNH
jgi:hypothetical protein